MYTKDIHKGIFRPNLFWIVRQDAASTTTVHITIANMDDERSSFQEFTVSRFFFRGIHISRAKDEKVYDLSVESGRVSMARTDQYQLFFSTGIQVLTEPFFSFSFLSLCLHYLDNTQIVYSDVDDWRQHRSQFQHHWTIGSIPAPFPKSPPLPSPKPNPEPVSLQMSNLRGIQLCPPFIRLPREILQFDYLSFSQLFQGSHAQFLIQGMRVLIVLLLVTCNSYMAWVQRSKVWFLTIGFLLLTIN